MGGRMKFNISCPECKGTGKLEDDCTVCGGEGTVTRNETVEVRIKAGTRDGQRIRLAGKGNAGVNGGPAGDLYVLLSVQEHDFFERRNADLFAMIPITIAQAALGAEILVPGLHGDEHLKIPEGTQTGTTFRLKGKGMPDPQGGGKGDLYYAVKVNTPSKLSREQRRLLQELERTLPAENRPAARNSSIFDKVKDIFG
jgi:molecular chaperone DnaJ